jgi:hypothetical protein
MPLRAGTSNPLANRFHVADRPNLDAAGACPRKLRRDPYGFVHALGLDHVEPGNHFLVSANGPSIVV